MQFLILPSSFFSFAFDFVIGKRKFYDIVTSYRHSFVLLVYVNSLLATLNAQSKMHHAYAVTTTTKRMSTELRVASTGVDPDLDHVRTSEYVRTL